MKKFRKWTVVMVAQHVAVLNATDLYTYEYYHNLKRKRGKAKFCDRPKASPLLPRAGSVSTHSQTQALSCGVSSRRPTSTAAKSWSLLRLTLFPCAPPGQLHLREDTGHRCPGQGLLGFPGHCPPVNQTEGNKCGSSKPRGGHRQLGGMRRLSRARLGYWGSLPICFMY